MLLGLAVRCVLLFDIADCDKVFVFLLNYAAASEINKPAIKEQKPKIRIWRSVIVAIFNSVARQTAGKAKGIMPSKININPKPIKTTSVTCRLTSQHLRVGFSYI